ELMAFGHEFRSTSDTEVLLAAYQRWGPACLARLNGMWAFAIYDRGTRKLFAARDRFGIKPLFCYHDERGLVLTSEIKTLRDSGYARLAPNWRIIANLLLEERLDETEDTFYERVSRVPAGAWLETDGSRPPEWRHYWSIEQAAEQLEAPADPAR